MIDFVDLMYFIVVFLLGVGLTLAFLKLVEWGSERRFKSRAGQLSKEKQTAQQDRLMAFMQDATELFKKMKEEGKEPKEMLKDGALLLLKYPDVSMKYGKQLWKMLQNSGAIGEDLGGLLGM